MTSYYQNEIDNYMKTARETCSKPMDYRIGYALMAPVKNFLTFYRQVIFWVIFGALWESNNKYRLNDKGQRDFWCTLKYAVLFYYVSFVILDILIMTLGCDRFIKQQR